MFESLIISEATHKSLDKTHLGLYKTTSINQRKVVKHYLIKYCFLYEKNIHQKLDRI
jgi:hypothetical protein